MLLHSPIRDVYLCIQGFDSRLACRICNNTVQSSIRADGPSAHRKGRGWEGENVTEENRKRWQSEQAHRRQRRRDHMQQRALCPLLAGLRTSHLSLSLYERLQFCAYKFHDADAEWLVVLSTDELHQKKAHWQRPGGSSVSHELPRPQFASSWVALVCFRFYLIVPVDCVQICRICILLHSNLTGSVFCLTVWEGKPEGRSICPFSAKQPQLEKLGLVLLKFQQDQISPKRTKAKLLGASAHPLKQNSKPMLHVHRLSAC